MTKYLIFLILVFFPYVSFSTNNLDTQPWIIIFFFLFITDLLKSKLNIVKTILVLTFPFFIQIIATFYTFKFDLIPFIRGYTSFLIFAFIYLYQIQYHNHIKNYINAIIIINYIYIIVGIIQVLTNPYIFNFLVLPRTSESRGITSLTPEPTQFGILLIFFTLIHFFLINKSSAKKHILLITINILSIFILARSATAVLYLIFGLLTWFFLNLNYKIHIKKYFYFFISFIFAILLFNIFLKDTRVYYIFSVILNGDIFLLLSNDKSITDRLLATIFSFNASYNNYFIPAGFNLSDTLESITFNFNNIIFTDYHTGYKIMSYWGSWIASYGFFFFLGLYYIYNKLNFIKTSINKKIIFSFIMLFLLGFSSLSVSFTLIPFFIAILLKHDNIY